MHDFYVDCTIEHHHGSIEGYVCGGQDVNWKNFIEGENLPGTFIEIIEAENLERIGVIKTLYVDEDARNQGIGTELMDDAMSLYDQHGADIVILFAGTREENNFDLVEWYETYGFESIDDSPDVTFMIYPGDNEELAQKLRDAPISLS